MCISKNYIKSISGMAIEEYQGKTLAWNKGVEKDLKKRFFDHESHIDYGSRCLFIEIGDGVAAKLYYSENNRDFCLKSQQKAFEKNVGPATGDSFLIHFLCILENTVGSLIDAAHKPLFGYLTQIADEPNPAPTAKELDSMIEKLKSIGLSGSDCVSCNLGRIDGNLVMIDFGRESHCGRETS